MRYRHHGIIAKMREQKVGTLTSEELDRVFKHCVSPIACKRSVAWMIEDGLTIEEIHTEFPIAQITAQSGFISRSLILEREG